MLEKTAGGCAVKAVYEAVKPPHHTGVKLINSRSPASSMLKSSLTMTSIQPLHLDPVRTAA